MTKIDNVLVEINKKKEFNDFNESKRPRNKWSKKCRKLLVRDEKANKTVYLDNDKLNGAKWDEYE